MTLSQIAAEARQLMNDHGLHGWTFGWDRAVTRLGLCSYRKRQITLSKPLTLRSSIEEIRDTILHEIAHAKVGPGHGHNLVWRSCARSIGARGERCGGAEITPVPGKWRATCPSCAKVFHRHRKPDVRKRACRRCGFEKGTLTYTMVSR